MRKVPPDVAFVLSCEHAGNEVPPGYAYLFKNAGEALNSHRGFDAGAYELFRVMKRIGVDYAQYNIVTRLLIDMNRSLWRKTLFSEFSGVLSATEKQKVIDQYYWPFRNGFKSKVDDLLHGSSRIIHVSVHAFTPVWKGEVRDADVGLLYNPSFGEEKALACLWRNIIKESMPGFKVRMNYPYLGKTDGHVAALRNQLGPLRYAGIELEMNQKYAGDGLVINQLAETFRVLVERVTF